MKINIILLTLSVLFLTIACSNIINPTYIVEMKVEKIYYNGCFTNIHYDIYFLSYKGEMYEFHGCPLMRTPLVGETVLINISDMTWVKIE